MKRKLVSSCVLAAGFLVICGTMFAHHGLAGAYDNTIRISVKAIVTELVWANPHAELLFDFVNDKGETEHWTMEQASPGTLVRIGWYKSTFKPGDVILVSFVPAKGDKHFASCGHIVMADGTMFITGQCGVAGGDISKLPVKPGYAAVEAKLPPFADEGQGAQGPTRRGPRGTGTE
jgi:Family of unknown function (DUF6152)